MSITIIEALIIALSLFIVCVSFIIIFRIKKMEKHILMFEESSLDQLYFKIDNLKKKIVDVEKNVGEALTILSELNERKDNQTNKDTGSHYLLEKKQKKGNDPEKQQERRTEIEDKNTEKPQNPEYKYLTVTNGKLTVTSVDQVYYYRAWSKNGNYYFEFFSNKTAKAINNRSVIIEPFCDKTSSSITPDQASSVESCQPGTLNSDFTLNTKTKIRFK